MESTSPSETLPVPTDLRIHKLTVENFKAVKFIQLYPDPNMNFIAGENGEGKTSLLDALMVLFAGDSKILIPEPIHAGAKKAIITGDLKEFVVQKIITPSGSRITVKDAEGNELKPAGGIIKRFMGRFSFDPLAFYAMKEEEQINTLLSFMGISKQVETIDVEVKVAEEKILERKRAIKALKADIGKNVPSKVMATSLDSVTAKYKDALAIEDARDMITTKTEEYNKLVEEAKAKYAEITEAQTVVAAYTGGSSEAVKAEYETIEKNNADAMIWDTHEANTKKLLDFETGKVEEEKSLVIVQKKRSDIIEKEKLPIPGLTIKEKSLRFKKGPLKQASSGEQIQISTLLAMKLNPGLKVLRITNGPMLDKAARATIKKLAEKYKFQVWMEVIDLYENEGFIIEDGTVLDKSKVEQVETEAIEDPIKE